MLLFVFWSVMMDPATWLASDRKRLASKSKTGGSPLGSEPPLLPEAPI
jgi:hypothetical protein